MWNFKSSLLAEAEDAAYGYVIGSSDGKLLFRHNQIDHEAYTYRVWAAPGTLLKAPFDSPHGNSVTPRRPRFRMVPFLLIIEPNLVTLESGPISTRDPWLPNWATTTVGNNVEAYADLAAPDGYVETTGILWQDDIGKYVRPSLQLERRPVANPNQIQAAVVQLFLDVNFFHDWYYDSGFKEEDGNAQMSNYGRGGLGGDSIRAEAQDFGGRNNANMFTPADGGRPKCRCMFSMVLQQIP